MTEETLGRARGWAAFLGSASAEEFPRHERVRAALEGGRLAEAAEDLDASPSRGGTVFLRLRMFLADALGDREGLARATEALPFAEEPEWKLWGLRTLGRHEEAAETLEKGIESVRGSERVWIEGMYSAYVAKAWGGLVLFAERLAELRALTSEESRALGWALEKEGRLLEAAEAYVASYRAEANPHAATRLLYLSVRHKSEAVDGRVLAFAREVEAWRSSVPPLLMLGTIESLEGHRWGRAARLFGRAVRLALVRALRRIARRASGRVRRGSSG